MNLGLSILETFSSLYYIHNANFHFVNMESEIFQKFVGRQAHWANEIETEVEIKGNRPCGPKPSVPHLRIPPPLLVTLHINRHFERRQHAEFLYR